MVSDLRISQGITRKQPFTISVNGEETLAYPGESLATVLLAAGWKMFRHTSLSGAPRGMFCGMGLCYDCLVTVNGQPNVRACHTLAQPGDVVERN
jgi:aerobic-type carbon monoxide dehydrogenase small subunit (CoxS/CutS family)